MKSQTNLAPRPRGRHRCRSAAPQRRHGESADRHRSEIEIYGIRLKCRYGKLTELQAMVSVLDHLSVLTVDALDALEWDLKEGSSVLISLRRERARGRTKAHRQRAFALVRMGHRRSEIHRGRMPQRNAVRP